MRIDDVKWDEQGLVPVVIQDAESHAVLTLAYANREALERTIETAQTHLFSRSRQALWRKGETSGHTQRVVGVRMDCDGDALLYRVLKDGPACHTGADTCFHAPLFESPEDREQLAIAKALAHLERTIAARKGADPKTSYVASLLADGVDRCAQKVGEEGVEVVIAAKNDDPTRLVSEVADLLFHTLVLLAERGVALDEIGAELLRRAAR